MRGREAFGSPEIFLKKDLIFFGNYAIIVK